MQCEPVAFYSQGAPLVGRVYEPLAPGGRQPAIAVIGSWLTVKEQMPAVYARQLAERGLLALTFDCRSFGASGGEPREVESARAKAEDIRNAIAYLGTRADVDPERIGVLAVCASAGYAVLAALEEPALRSLVMVAPWLHDAEIVRELYGGDDGIRERLDQARAARAKYVARGTVEYVKAASNDDTSAAMYWPGDFLDYYLNPKRGAVPEWGGRFALMAWSEWLAFDPIALAPRLRTPLRIVSSEQSATPAGTKRFAAGLRVAHDVVWTAGTQFDFYDEPATVSFAAARAVEHFERTLA